MRTWCVALLFGTAAVAAGQTYTVLINFEGTNGATPVYGALVQGTDGALYGTTSGGGTYGQGTVFRVTTEATLTTLHSFQGKDGSSPWGGLVVANGGNLYGTTLMAGLHKEGTIFGITPEGVLSTLHNLAGKDGSHPTATLVQGTDGKLYGTTTLGGAYNTGEVFKITPGGAFTLLYSFCPTTDCTTGYSPYGGLVESSGGNFLGTTVGGGPDGSGTIFKITPEGSLSTLHNFIISTDGSFPNAALLRASDGSIYGTAKQGGSGAHPQAGTIFEITSEGKFTTLFSLSGAEPYGALIQATDGNLYGTTCDTNGGVVISTGAIFKITLGGTPAMTTLHNFDPSNGGCSLAGLVQATDGNFYGTTSGNNGATPSDGTIFQLSTGLGPFVKTLPLSGKAGAAVKILGTNLTGATSVSFNGVAAAFTVVSGAEITSTVPTGATTGIVRVSTPGGTLSSNVVFRVP